MIRHDTSADRSREADQRTERTHRSGRIRRSDSQGSTRADATGGREAGSRPNVIDLRPSTVGARRYVRVQAGDVVAEGDRGPVSGAIDRWRVTAVTPDLVAGRDLRTGRAVAWDRDWLERQLTTGGMSTGLSEFVRVAVRPVYTLDGSPADPPAVRAVAYGDDGRRYERVYRPVDGASGSTVAPSDSVPGADTGGGGEPPDASGLAVELIREDRSTARLPWTLRTLLDRKVAAALADAGYEVRPA